MSQSQELHLSLWDPPPPVTGVDGSFGKEQDPKLMTFQVSVPLVLRRA